MRHIDIAAAAIAEVEGLPSARWALKKLKLAIKHGQIPATKMFDRVPARRINSERLKALAFYKAMRLEREEQEREQELQKKLA